MAVFALIMLVLAFACFVAATFNAGLRWNLVAAGLAFWIVISLVNVINSLT